MPEQLIAILSMLHESADRNSGTRAFREKSVLEWALQRLSLAKSLSGAGIVCWEDQLPRVASIATEAEACVLAKGPRTRMAQVEAISGSRRWADGWRGGLLGACAFDLGFYAPWALELADRMNADAVVLVDPSSALVDPNLIDAMAEHADNHPAQEFCFAPAAPGLCGVLLRRDLLHRLAATKSHPGKLLQYHPDQVSRELLGSDSCVHVSARLSRTTHRFTIDSDRQLRRVERATLPLNGQLISSGAEELVRRVESTPWVDSSPREIVLDLNEHRRTRAVFMPGAEEVGAAPHRPVIDLAQAKALFADLANNGDDVEDARLTIGSIGDPLLSPDLLFDVIDAARSVGIGAVQVETDLLPDDVQTIGRLVRAPVDIISVHLPAITDSMYRTVMGHDGYKAVLENIRLFIVERQQRSAGLPLLAPIFTKCRQNMREMEGWYDQWLRAVGCAVIKGPTTWAGAIPDTAVADMSPPRRHACIRLASRLTVLSDGRVVSCEQDVKGRQEMGKVGNEPIGQIWQHAFATLREDHRLQQWDKHAACAQCTEWHRS